MPPKCIFNWSGYISEAWLALIGNALFYSSLREKSIMFFVIISWSLDFSAWKSCIKYSAGNSLTFNGSTYKFLFLFDILSMGDLFIYLILNRLSWHCFTILFHCNSVLCIVDGIYGCLKTTLEVGPNPTNQSYSTLTQFQSFDKFF